MFNVSTIGHTTHIKPTHMKTRITKAVATVDNAMLGRIWQKLDYRLDVCRVTNGAHIEHL